MNPSKFLISLLFFAQTDLRGESSSDPTDFPLFRSRHIEGIGLVLPFGLAGDDYHPFGADWGWLFQSKDPANEKDLLLRGYPLLATMTDGSGAPVLTRSVIAIRLQSEMDASPLEAEPATFNWTRDGTEGDHLAYQGALIADLYLADKGFLSFDPQKRGVHIRAAAQWNRNELPSQESDVRELFLGFSYLSFAPLANDWEPIKKHQTDRTDFGLRYTQNELTGEAIWSLDLGWSPVASIGPIQLGRQTSTNEGRVKKQLKAATDEEIQKLTATAQTKGKTIWNVLIDEGRLSRWNYTLASDFRLRYGSLNDVVTGDAEFGDWGAEITAEASVGRIGCFKAGYKMVAFVPIDGAQTDAHRLFAEVYPFRHWALSIHASYEYGELAPDFVKRDRLLVGLSWKF